MGCSGDSVVRIGACGQLAAGGQSTSRPPPTVRATGSTTSALAAGHRSPFRETASEGTRRISRQRATILAVLIRHGRGRRAKHAERAWGTLSTPSMPDHPASETHTSPASADSHRSVAQVERRAAGHQENKENLPPVAHKVRFVAQSHMAHHTVRVLGGHCGNGQKVCRGNFHISLSILILHIYYPPYTTSVALACIV